MQTNLVMHACLLQSDKLMCLLYISSMRCINIYIYIYSFVQRACTFVYASVFSNVVVLSLVMNFIVESIHEFIRTSKLVNLQNLRKKICGLFHRHVKLTEVNFHFSNFDKTASLLSFLENNHESWSVKNMQCFTLGGMEAQKQEENTCILW